jgi:hypothetical protein
LDKDRKHIPNKKIKYSKKSYVDYTKSITVAINEAKTMDELLVVVQELSTCVSKENYVPYDEENKSSLTNIDKMIIENRKQALITIQKINDILLSYSFNADIVKKANEVKMFSLDLLKKANNSKQDSNSLPMSEFNIKMREEYTELESLLSKSLFTSSVNNLNLTPTF